MYTNEEFIEYFKDNYPNYVNGEKIVIDNNFFSILTKEELSRLLIVCDSDKRWYLSMYLFEYLTPKVIKDMIIYIIKNKPEMVNNIFATNNDLDEKCIFKIYETIYDNDVYKIDDDIKYDEIDLYNYILCTRKKYEDYNLDEKDRKIFYDRMYMFLINKIKDNIDGRIIDEIIGYILSNDIDNYKIYYSINYHEKVEDYIAKGKFDIDKLAKINVDVLRETKKSNVVKLINMLSEKNIVIDDRIKNALIKMVYILGYDNIKKIIDYDKNLKSIFSSFYIINLEKYDNHKKESFINLFMGDNINDPNNLINTIYNDKYDLIKNNLNAVFNGWDSIMIRFKNQNLKTKTAFIYELLSESKYVLNPDEIKLEGKIIDTCVDNKQFVSNNSSQVIERLRYLYKEMKHNYQKTIPYVSGIYGNYSYEMLLADDPTLFIVGSNTKCCFKVYGDADSFIKYCVENKNARVLVIRDKRNDICAMAPMYRNGNLVVVNSIESNNVKDLSYMKEMFDILKRAGDEIIDISDKNEPEEEHISAVIIGNYKNQIDKFLNYEKAESLSNSKTEPLVENLYTNVKNCYFVSKSSNYDSSKVHRFEPPNLYSDPRSDVLELEVEEINDGVRNIINSIAYESKEKMISLENAYRVTFNKDWYIILNKDYTVESEIVGNDERARIEYVSYLMAIVEFANECKKENYYMI